MGGESLALLPLQPPCPDVKAVDDRIGHVAGGESEEALVKVKKGRGERSRGEKEGKESEGKGDSQHMRRKKQRPA